MASKLQEVVAQLRAAKEGVSRVEQYVVEEATPILQTVSEDDYNKIIESRRCDFVVGSDTLGYADGGREIWEGAEAARERKREADDRTAQATEAQNKNNSLKKGSSDSKDRALDPAGAKLTNAFRVGSMSEGLSVTAPVAVEAHQDVDDMLKDMCRELEADEPTSVRESVPRNAVKRKSEGGVGRVAKKAVAQKLASVKAELKSELQAEPVQVAVNVKREPHDDTASSCVQNLCSSNAMGAHAPMGSLETVKKETKRELDTPSADEGFAKRTKEMQCDSGTVKTETNSFATQSDGGLWFFLIDAFEDERATPPRVSLFGKVPTSVPGTFKNCCLVVEHIERCVHLLLTVPDLDEALAPEIAAQADSEFDCVCLSQNLDIKKLRAKLKWRKYAFEKSLPQGSGRLPFLKVLYEQNGFVSLPPGMSGQNFSHAFGAQTPLLERLLISKRIMGPSWLRLKPGSFRVDEGKVSYSPVEFRITPSAITVAKTDAERRHLTEMGMPVSSPPIRVMSISMQTVQHSVGQSHEPVVVACSMHPNFSTDGSEAGKELNLGTSSWIGLRRLDARPLPRNAEKTLTEIGVDHFNSEAMLLQSLLSKVHAFDPDVVAGHSTYGFDLEILSSRMAAQNIKGWQRLGRVRQSRRIPTGSGFWIGTALTAGRLVCDLILQAKELLPKMTSYSLPSLAQEMHVDSNLQIVEPESLAEFYACDTGLVGLAKIVYCNALSIARLTDALQILPLSRQLTNIAGNMWNMSLQNKRAERNEILLCHEFHRGKFVLPDSQKKKGKQDFAVNFDEAEDGEITGGGPRRGKAAYSGGLVLEPKAGLYDDYVMMLDFNSLYPSIIQEYNICFTTVHRPDETAVSKCETEMDLLNQTHLPDGTTEEGVLPQVLKRLVRGRHEVKAVMKSERDPRRQQILEIKQKALKLTANSMYGCLGYKFSRFYAKPLAALITAKGREALQTTITVVEHELQLNVVYGDTDSVFVNSGTQDFHTAMQVGQQIKKLVNKRFKKLEIEVDGVFRRLLLLKKKKYAASKIREGDPKKYENEYKGLDIVRRDWCGLSKEMGDKIVTQLLEGNDKEQSVHWIHEYLREKGKEMDKNLVPIEAYAITKALSKAPEDYPDGKHQPHVQVALRLKQRGKVVRSNEDIPYIICEQNGEGTTKESFAQRSRHPLELSLDPKLKVDVAWYKSQQVHSLISRLLAPVEGTSPAQLAECLSMDPTRFTRVEDGLPDGGRSQLSDIGLTRDVAELLDRSARWKAYETGLPGVTCSKTGVQTAWKDLLQPEAWALSGADALFRMSDGSEINPVKAQNLFVLQVRLLLRGYSEGWVRCTHDVGIEKSRRTTKGHNEISERRVMQELEYMDYLCECVESATTGEDCRGCLKAAANIKSVCQRLLDCNGLNWVDCGQIFGSIFRAGA